MMATTELSRLPNPKDGQERSWKASKKPVVVKYCFFNQKLGMTFKIHNGKITLDGIDKWIVDGSQVPAARRKSSRKSGRFSVLSVVDEKTTDGKDEQKDEYNDFPANEDGNEEDDNRDDMVSDEPNIPSTPNTSSKKLSGDISVIKTATTPPLSLPASAPLAIAVSSPAPIERNNSSGANSFSPVVATLEYSGIAYGSNNYSASDSTTPLSDSSASAASQKILVESEQLFGHNIKKLVKVSGSSLNIKKLATTIKETCQLSQSIDQLLLTFHDPDVDDFVVLDEYSLADFLQLSKKVIHLQSVAPPIPGAEVPPESEVQLPLPIEDASSLSSLRPPPTPEKKSGTSQQNAATVPKTLSSAVSKSHIISDTPHLKLMKGSLSLYASSPHDLWKAKLLADIGGFVSFLFNVSVFHEMSSITSFQILCKESQSTTWKIMTEFPPLGSRVLSLNDVYISDLDRTQQIALLKQRSRPFVMEFEIYNPDTPFIDSITNSAKSSTSSTNAIKYSLFLSKYANSSASKLQKQIDKILDDFHTCDWAEAKRMGTGLPQTTVVSLYKYIEQEMVRLDLFNAKRTRGAGAPAEMMEIHWAAIRGHIETMIFKRIITSAKQLWHLFHEPITEDDLDIEDPQNVFYINKQFDAPPAGHEPVLPKITPTTKPLPSPAAANNSNKESSPEQEHPLAASSSSHSASGTRKSEEDSATCSMHLELSPEHGLNIKLAYLRFVTLEILGVPPGDAPKSTGPTTTSSEIASVVTSNDTDCAASSPLVRQDSEASAAETSGIHKFLHSKYPSDMVSIERILQERNHTVFQEEWYQAIRGLHQLHQLETPGEMMQRIKIVVDLITRALEKYINRPSSIYHNKSNRVHSDTAAAKQEGLANDDETADVVRKCHVQQRGQALVCPACAQIHLTNTEDESILPPTSMSSTTLDKWTSMYGHVHAAVCCKYQSKDNGEQYGTDNDDNNRKPITGDDLLPGIVFALIQANPPSIECLLWLCAEFRHPTLHMGEEAYCLATLSSALEFVRRATYKPFDVIPHIIYDHFLLRYTHTLKLMLACKQGDLSLVKTLVEQGADVNGLSPDQVDSPLTACIRYQQPSIMHYLLFEQTVAEVNVDTVVHLYRGPHERCTALHVATKNGEVMMVLMLLAAGANRYLSDEEGHTPLSIAMELEAEFFSNHSETLTEQDRYSVVSSSYSLLHTILLADVHRIDIVDMILKKDPLAERLLAGLILQGVDVHHVHSKKDCTEQCTSDIQQMHSLITPLMAAVLTENVTLVKMLLSIPFVESVYTKKSSQEGGKNTHDCYFGEYYNPVNEVNEVGENALLVCVEKCLVTPSETLLLLVVVLLRAEADRFKEDKFGQTSVNILESFPQTEYYQHVYQQTERVPDDFDGNSDGNLSSTTLNNNPFDLVHGAPPAISLNSEKKFPFQAGALAFYRDVYPNLGYVASKTAATKEDDDTSAKLPVPALKISYANIVTNVPGEIDGFNILPHLFHNHHDSPFLSQSEKDQQIIAQILDATDKTMSGYYSFVQNLLLQDPHKPDRTQIFDYARHHDYASVRALLLQAVDVNVSCTSKGYSALIASVYNRDIHMIQLLLRSANIAAATCPIAEHWARIFYDITLASTSLAKSASTSVAANHDSLDDDFPIPSLKQLFPASYSFANTLLIDQAGRGGMTALHYAAQLGLTTVVGLLLGHHAKRDCVNTQQHAPADIAVANGHMEAANVLRFDPERVSICLAAKHGDWLVMKALLLQGIDINVVKEHHHANKGRHYELDTPLIAAVAHGQFELVKRLLTELEEYAGKEEFLSQMTVYPQILAINTVNTIGQSALMYAAARGEENMVLLLLKHGADRYLKDSAGHDAVHWAVAQGHVHIATILKHDPELIYVHDLIRKNDYDAVVAMFKQGVDVNQRRERLFVATTLTPSDIVIDADNLNQSSSVVDHSAHASLKSTATSVLTTDTSDSHASTSSAAKQSVYSPAQLSQKPRRLSAPTAARLEAIHEFARMFIPGETPVIVAARYARLDVLQLLFKAPNVDIDAVDDTNGWSALFHAAEQGHEEIIKFLLVKKANRKLEDCLGRCARDIALLQQHEVLAAMIDADPYHIHIHDTCQHGLLMLTIGLLKQGCPPIFRDERPGMAHQTPLMAAASGGQVDIIRMLLRYPQVYETKDDGDDTGRTALMRAAAIGALDVTAVLLNAGCDRTIVDKQGLSARDHAARHSFSVMFQFMSQSMVR